MATATRKYIAAYYTLELNEVEARTLTFILNRIGGDLRNSPRRDAKSIRDALDELGVEPIEANVSEAARSIYFV